jgi:Flp pilus assembly protein TadD
MPESSLVWGWHAQFLREQSRFEQARKECEWALRIAPHNALAQNVLGEVLLDEKKYNQAADHFRLCLRLDPDNERIHVDLAKALEMQGNVAEAIAEYRQAIRLQPDLPDALNNLAWILASDPHAELRDGGEAVRLANRACELTHNAIPTVIGTLAAAYAEAGRFDEAVAAAQKAHDLALSLDKKGVAAKNLELLVLYRSHQPYHQTTHKP